MGKYLVTGGAGFIGSHVVDELLKQGHRVRVLDNFLTGSLSNLGDRSRSGLEVVDGDIRSTAVCLDAMQGIETVIHLAALNRARKSVIDPMTALDVNVLGTTNLVFAAGRWEVKKFVFASSSSVYGFDTSVPLSEQVECFPRSPYALSKLACEHWSPVANALYGLNFTSLRYFSVFGPRQDGSGEHSAVIPKLIRAIQDGREFEIYGDGTQTRDFTYVDNVVKATIELSKLNLRPDTNFVNVGTGNPISINEVVERIMSIMGKRTKVVHVEPKTGEFKHSCADTTKLDALMDTSDFIMFSEGLKRTIGYYTNG